MYSYAWTTFTNKIVLGKGHFCRFYAEYSSHFHNIYSLGQEAFISLSAYIVN